jgi:hypothetical protein
MKKRKIVFESVLERASFKNIPEKNLWIILDHMQNMNSWYLYFTVSEVIDMWVSYEMLCKVIFPLLGAFIILR